MTDELEWELSIFDRGQDGPSVGNDWMPVLPVFRSCCDCGDEFQVRRDSDRRCVSCQVADDDALDDVRGYSRDDLLFGGNW